MLGLHRQFPWFSCSQDIGYEKPAAEIFDATFEQARFGCPTFKGARYSTWATRSSATTAGEAAGFQALLLDRSNNPKVTAYQDWVEGPDYPGKSEDDIRRGTVQSLETVVELLVQLRSEQAAESAM